MQVTLKASFDQDKDKFKVKGDNSGRFWMDFDATQYPQVCKLGLLRTKVLLKVTIEEDDQKGAK